MRKIKNSIINLSTIVVLGITFAGCLTSSTKVLALNESILEIQKYNLVKIENEKISNAIPQEDREYFDTKIKDLFNSNGYAEGKDLKIKYNFLMFNRGNEASRMWLGGQSGKSELLVKTSFYDAKTNIHLGEIESRCEGTGLFGGSFKGALDKVIKEIYNHSKENYLN